MKSLEGKRTARYGRGYTLEFKVPGCRRCPFAAYEVEIGSMDCNVADMRQIPFSQEQKSPEWCPLRQSSITVRRGAQ